MRATAALSAAMALLAAAALLGGCGQKGSLTLPQKSATPTAASSPQR